MNNPLRILQALDRQLTAPADLTVFGRAALALGYPDSPPAFGATRDVDAILPLTWMAAADENVDFWQAQQRANAELEPEGLYLTHLFRELDVILMADWMTRRQRISLDLRQLTVFRPSTLDLILTKMARADENDLSDVRFLLQQEPLGVDELRGAFQRARVPDVAEIQELFRAAQPKVLAFASSSDGP